jgi:hypothetical protein
MLFDLRGRRRRAVQVVYLLLAVLIGGGLVLFGIGGGASGGLLDAITGGSGGGNANSQIQKQIDRQEKRLAASPNDLTALKALVRDHYALAAADQPSGSSQFPEDAKPDLRAAAQYWQRYLDVEKGNPDASLAALALQVYDTSALNQPKEAAKAMAIIAERQNTFEAYLALVQRATAAGDTRTADLAAQKAVDLAPKDQKKQVKQLAEQAKKPSAQTTPQQ